MSIVFLTGGGGALIVLGILALMYFIPSFIAYSRNSTNVSGVFLVNLLTGWTVIGWVAALVMAVNGPTDGPKMVFCSACHAQMVAGLAECPSCGVHLTGQKITERKCPYCAEMIKAEAVVCRYCGRDVEPHSGASLRTTRRH